VITSVLVEKYSQMEATGWRPTTSEIERDVRLLFGESFQNFLKR